MNTVKNILQILHRGDIDALLIIAAILGFYMLRQQATTFKRISWVIITCIFAASLIIFVRTATGTIFYPRIWDFTAFYLYGKVAAQGHDYYSPEFFNSVYHSLNLPNLDYKGSLFEAEVLPVGFLYPPPTIFLFMPLGFFSYQTALTGWTIFNLIFAAGSIYLMYDLFLKSYLLNGFLLAAILFFLLEPVRMSLSFSQTNFILLFLLLLMYKNADKNIAGIFLALAFLVKPYMIVFGLFFILMKRWKAIVFFTCSILLATGLTFLVFGKAPFFSYLFNNPSKRLPAWVFSEEINQSLDAVLLRNHIISIDSLLIFRLIVGAILILLGFYLAYLYKKRLINYIWMVLLLVGLLIYPGTLSYYGVTLLFIVCQFFDERKQLGFKNIYLNAFAVGLFYYLSSFSVFTAICFLLLVILIRSIMSAYSVDREYKVAFQD